MIAQDLKDAAMARLERAMYKASILSKAKDLEAEMLKLLRTTENTVNGASVRAIEQSRINIEQSFMWLARGLACDDLGL